MNAKSSVKVHTFHQPVKIIQVFRNINTYGKAEKSFANRKAKLAWKPISSIAGFVKDEIVHLPESIIDQPNFKSCELIILLDDNLPPIQNILFTQEKNHCYKRNSLNKLDAFQLKFNETIEIHLAYSYFQVGLPARSNFKICELQQEKPVAIKINGKTDFSLTGRRERNFTEQEYIFVDLGNFSNYSLLPSTAPAILKTAPTNSKVIDLNKPLW